MTFLLLSFMCACVFAYTVYPSMCFHTGQKRTKPLQVLNSLSTVMVWSVFRTTRYWSAPAGCMFTNSPLTFRAATSPSSLLYIPVSVTCCVSCALVHFLNTADNTSYWSFSLLPPARKPHVFFNFFFISHTSQGNTARSLSQLLRGHAHDDADPVRVAVHQHDSQQQNCLHVSPQTRRDYLHCKYAVKTNFSTVEMLLLAWADWCI